MSVGFRRAAGPQQQGRKERKGDSCRPWAASLHRSKSVTQTDQPPHTHTLTVLSAEPVAKVFESGEAATLSTQLM